MFKCLDCDKVYEEAEYSNGCWGCPYCGCPASESLPECENCTEPYEEWVYCGLCPECREKIKSEYRFNIDGCYKLSKESPQPILLNAFLAEMFTIEQIENILLNELKQANADCLNFIDDDEDWFFDRVLEMEVGKSEL